VKLLIVEDEAITALHLAAEFLKLGCVVTTEASGEAALRHAETELPEAVLMDIHLAGKLDGIETAKVLLGRRSTSIVFMSGYERYELEERLRREIGPLVRLFPKPLRSPVIRQIFDELSSTRV